jgi:arylsulfatase A-like enzyme
MRHLLPVIAVVLFAGVLPSNALAQAKKKPNIVVILGDDMGYADVGYHGCKDIPTPHIDSIAKNGVRFSSGYVSGPYCSPTRAGLMTGRYQTRFGHEFNPGGGKQGLPIDQFTIAQRMKALGYITALIGKWHLGNDVKMHPNDRGFDEYFGFLGGAHPYFPGKGKEILRDKKAVDEKEYLTDALGREACAFIDRNAKEPFFLYLAFNAVHTPMQATDKYLNRFPNLPQGQRKTYCAMMSAMDDAIGQVLAKLREKGLEDDTLVIFFSDNGGPTMVGTTINGSINFPLRGSKRQLLEGGIRVPFCLQWKGKLPAGKTYDHPIIQLDILPTCLAATGSPLNAGGKGVAKGDSVDGVNLLPFLEGKKTGPPHEALFWRFGNELAMRKGDWNIVRYDNTGVHLYNLKDDIGQSKNLAAKEPERLREMQEAWNEWNKSNVAPLWGGGKKVKMK